MGTALRGKVTAVTGASSGIGRAIAASFAAQGSPRSVATRPVSYGRRESGSRTAELSALRRACLPGQMLGQVDPQGLEPLWRDMRKLLHDTDSKEERP